MEKQNTKHPLAQIKIDRPVRNTDDFQGSKVDLIEYCEKNRLHTDCNFTGY